MVSLQQTVRTDTGENVLLYFTNNLSQTTDSINFDTRNKISNHTKYVRFLHNYNVAILRR